MELVDHTSEDALLLWLCLLLVTGPRCRVGHSDLGRLLWVGQAQTGGQGNRGLKNKKFVFPFSTRVRV